MVKGVISKLALCAMICVFAASSAFASTITAPANGSQLGALPTFTVDRAGQDYGWAYVGTTLGGFEYYSASLDNNTSFTVPGLPADNATVYVRLWGHASGSWTYADYNFKKRAAGGYDGAVMTSPVSGSNISTTTTFTWTDLSAIPINQFFHYWLAVGTSGAGSADVYNAAIIGTNTVTLRNLPKDVPLNVRMYTRCDYFETYQDFSYNTAVATISLPADGGTLVADQVFNWNNDGGDQYWLYIGSTVGGWDYYSVDMGSSLTATVPGLPFDGSPVHVRLWSHISGAWYFNDYTFTARTGSTDLAVITSPAADNGTVDNSTASFTWTPAATTGATLYWMWVGSSQGGADLGSYNLGTSNTVSPSSVGWPSVIWVRLFTRINGFEKNPADTHYHVRKLP